MKSEGGDVNLKVRFNVGEVKSTLLSVSELEDSDWDLVISKRWSRYLVHAPTGRVIYLVRENGTYRLPPMWANKAQGADKAEVVNSNVIEKSGNKNENNVKPTETRDDEGFQWQPVGQV